MFFLGNSPITDDTSYELQQYSNRWWARKKKEWAREKSAASHRGSTAARRSHTAAASAANSPSVAPAGPAHRGPIVAVPPKLLGKLIHRYGPATAAKLLTAGARSMDAADQALQRLPEFRSLAAKHGAARARVLLVYRGRLTAASARRKFGTAKIDLARGLKILHGETTGQ